MVLAGLFVAVAAILCAAAVLAVLGITHVHMSGAEAVERDGMARGMLAPAWSLADSAGQLHKSPPARPLQLVVFTDHSLKSFPSVADGLRETMEETMTRGNAGGRFERRPKASPSTQTHR